MGREAVVATHRTDDGGARRPTGPTGGQATPELTEKRGETDGRDRAISNRHTHTPADGGAGRPRARSRLHAAGAPARRGLSAGGVAPNEEGECRAGGRSG